MDTAGLDRASVDETRAGVTASRGQAPESDQNGAGAKQLAERLQAIAARRIGLALGLWGEAGIGKSFQVARLLPGLPCRSLSVHAEAPLAELVRSLPRPARLPLLATRVLGRLVQGEEPETVVTADALAALLAGLSPFVLHLDDLQGAGPERLELMEALAVRVARSRGVGLLITGRTLPPQGFEPHRQHPLDARQSCELLHAEIGAELPPEALAWMYERAAGNPLFTLEYFRLLARQGYLWNDARRWHWRAPPPELMPVTVEALTERVLQEVMVPGPLSDVSAAKAMLPRSTSGPQLAAVAGRTPAAARQAEAQLERLGVLSRGEFAHPLYREVSLKMLGAERRQVLARRALRVFAHDPEVAATFLDGARLAPAPSLALLEQAALSAERAGRSANAAALWVRAADQAAGDHGLLPERQAKVALQAARANETSRPAEALRLARRAAGLRPGDSETALYLAGRLVQHSRRLSDAQEVLDQLPPEVRSGPVWVSWQLSFLVSCGQYAQALSLWDAAALHHDLSPGQPNPGQPRPEQLSPGTAYSVAACLVQTGQPERAALMAEQGLNHPGTTPTQRASLLNVASIACAFMGQPEQAEAHLEAALDLARAHGLSQLRGALLQNRAKNLERTERFADALAAAQESLVAYAEAGDSLRHANAGVLVAGHLCGFGRFEEAETLLLGSLGVLERQGTSRFLVVAQTTLASLYLDWQPPHGAVLALKLAHAALEQARLLGTVSGSPVQGHPAPGNPGAGITAFALATLARAVTWAGDPVQAVAYAQEAVSSARQASDESAFLALAALAAAHLASGQPEQARPALADAQSAARSGNFILDLRRLMLEVARLDADLASAREQWAWFNSHGLLGGVKLAERAFPELAMSGARTDQVLPTTSPDALHLEILGTMRLGPPGSTQAVRGRKRRELLAALLEARLRGRPQMSRLDLLDAVYPGAGVSGTGEVQAAASLKELVHLTRAAFGQGVIQTAPDGYALGNVTSDAEQVLKGGDTTLWRGLYLENAAPEGRDEAVGEALLLTLHARTEAALATDPHEAARCARLLLEAEPYSLEALRLNLRALRASGNHRSLTRLYADAQARWREVGETLPGRWADILA